MKRTLLIVLISTFFFPAIMGQMGQRISAYISIKGSETINYETDIPMLIVEPENELFDPSELVFAYPELVVDREKISISLPSMEAYSDTLYMMMLVKDRAYSRRGLVNIVVIGVYSDDRLDYFIDNNSDYTFSDDEAKFTFSPAVERVRLDMQTRNNSMNEFYLFNPIYEPTGRPTPEVFTGSWDKIDSEFSLLLDLSGTFGSGNSTVTYKPVDAGVDQVKYDAIIFAFGLFRAGVVANWKNLNLGLYAGFEQVQYTERNKFSYLSVGGQTIDYMAGLWMWSKVSAEITLGYDINMNSRVKLTPVVGAGLWMPVDGRQFDPEINPPANAAYHDTWKYDAGMKMKVLINDDSFFTLKLGAIVTNFDATDYLVDYQDSYDLDYRQLYLSLGYTVQLTNRK